jgi:predicted transcriptional regulator
MSVEELIKELNALPLAQRLEVVDAVLDADDSWIPESFLKGMADIEAGRVVDMETALTQKPPSRI